MWGRLFKRLLCLDLLFFNLRTESLSPRCKLGSMSFRYLSLFISGPRISDTVQKAQRKGRTLAP